MVDQDQAIANRFHEGDLEALEIIINRYQGLIYRMGLKMFKDEAEAADFSQDTFLRAFEKRHRYDPKKPFQPWFLKVALNVGRTRFKKRREIPMGEEMPERQTEAIGANGLIKEEQRNLVQQVMQTLSPKYYESLVLRFEAELSLKEIASTLGLSLGTVKSRLNRGLNQFRKAYQEMGGGQT